MLPPVSRPLSSLRVGEGAEVEGVEAAASPDERAITMRLLEMGFVPGTHVAVVKVAPFGDPLELRVRGYHVSLRRAEASRVHVRGDTPEAAGE